MPASKPTLRTVARAAGVSAATVSMALRNHPRVPERTARRIRQVARELGYTPNPYVSSLMAHVRQTRTQDLKNCLGILDVFGNSENPLACPYLSLVINGVRQRAAELGSDVCLLNYRDLGPEPVAKALAERRVQGLIVTPLRDLSEVIDLRWEKYAAVTVGFRRYMPKLPRVSPDRFQNASLAIENLRRLGYKKIGLVAEQLMMRWVDYAWGAAYMWSQNAPEGVRQELIFSPERLERRAFAEWFARESPDAILTSHRVVLDWLKADGLRVPEDIGFAMLSTPPGDASISGVDDQSESVGAATVDLLEAMMHRNEFGIPETPRIVLIRGRWHGGSTVRTGAVTMAR